MNLKKMFLFAPVLLASAATSVLAGDEPALREIYKNDFRMGVAVSGFMNPNSNDGKLAGKHFDRIVAGNEMKWESVERAEGQFNFSGSDNLAKFKDAYGMQLHGHVLVWYSQTPNWVHNGLKAGSEADRATILKRMKNHIDAFVGHCKNNFHWWDVANESVMEDGSMRKSFWYNIGGEDYLKYAFDYARAADPTATLVYNDFDTDLPAKRDGIVRLVNELNKDKKRVDVIGMQCHWRYTDPTMRQVEDTIKAFLGTGCKVVISELDIDMLPRDRANPNPYGGELPPLLHIDLRERYRDAYALFLKYRDGIEAVTLWGLTDAGTWLDGYPFYGRRNAPLLFDRQSKPKQAFWGVIDAAAMYGRDLGDRFIYNNGVAWEKELRTVYTPKAGTVSDPFIFRYSTKALICAFSTNEDGGNRVIKFVYSNDDGETWSKEAVTAVKINGVDCTMPRLGENEDGKVVLTTNGAGIDRIFVSADQGATWTEDDPNKRLLPYPNSCYGYLNLKNGQQIECNSFAAKIGLKDKNLNFVELIDGRIAVSCKAANGASEVRISKKPVADITKAKAGDFVVTAPQKAIATNGMLAGTGTPRVHVVGTDGGKSVQSRRGLSMMEYK